MNTLTSNSQIIYSTELPATDKYFELFGTTGRNEEYKLTKEELALAISNSYLTISAYYKQRLVGFGRLVSDGIIHAMIYEMIIHPEYQFKGIGSEILKMLVNKCEENNIRDIQLFCAKSKRVFYEKHGFLARPDDAPGMQLKRT